MRSLRLALLGLWWRRSASVTVWLLAVVCAAAAAAGPAYLAGARDAVLQTTLRDAPVGSEGTGIMITEPAGSRAQTISLERNVAQAFSGVRAYDAPVMSIESDRTVFAPDGQVRATLPVVYRQDSCRHVRILAGRCISDDDPQGVDITSATAAALGYRVGSQIPLANFMVRAGGKDRTSLRVRGIYDPVQPQGAYWLYSDHQYFNQVARFAAASVPSGDGALVSASTWAFATVARGDVVTVGADLVLNPDRVHAGDLAAFEPVVNTATTRVQVLAPGNTGAEVTLATEIPSVLFTAGQGADAVDEPILVIAAQLLVLSLVVLYLVMLSSGESRAAEIALGKLRGLKPRETVLHALLEPLVLLVAAVPVGVAGCYLVLRAVGPSVLGPHAVIGLPAAAWVAAAAAGLGGLAAAGLASVAVLRRPVLDQWRRTEHRSRRAGWLVEAVVIVASAAGFVVLFTSSRTSGATGGAGFLAALAPGLLAAACALIGARLLPFAGLAGLRATRGTRFVAFFIALRQVARRPGDRQVFSLLTVAVALVVFGVSSRAVFDQNRIERARSEVGADRVVSIAPDSGPDASAVVAHLDPSGTRAVAVYDGPLVLDTPADLFSTYATATPPTALIVDPARFAAVADWRSDFGSAGTLAQELRDLYPLPPAPPSFVGTQLRLTARVLVRSGLNVDLHAALTDHTGAAVDVDLGVIDVSAPTAAAQLDHWTARVPQCAAGCLFRRLSIVTSVNDNQTPHGQLQVLSLEAVHAVAGQHSVTTAVLPRLLSAHWTALNPTEDGGSAESVSTANGVLTIRIPADTSVRDLRVGYGALAAVPAFVPALATRSQLPGGASGELSILLSPDNDDLQLRARATNVLPRSGDAGVVLSRPWVVAGRPAGYDQYAANEVWLAADAPADFPARLAAAGLTVQGVQSQAQRAAQLARQGPGFAVAMLVFGAGAAGGLAVAGATTMQFVASRRRLYELAALRTLGLSTRRLLGSLVLEQVFVSVLASVVGVVAGLVGTRAALARLPEFADRPTFPPLILDLPVLPVLLAGAVVSLTMIAAATIGGLGLVRRAGPLRLREAQG